MTRKLILTRSISQAECPWLDEDLPAGTALWSYSGFDYGCLSPTGIAVSARKAETPFFEVPADAVKGVGGD